MNGWGFLSIGAGVIAVVVLVVAVTFGVVREQEKTVEQMNSCVTVGGTWIGGTTSSCVMPREQ